MSKTLFNAGWAFRTKMSAFAELGGATGQWSDIDVPHDALIGVERQADAPSGAATGYAPSGAFEYRKYFSVAEEDAGKLIVLEFDGVYRNAMVYVNGALAGSWAFGYSRFTVRIDPFLVFGATNEVRVACVAHKDSRWYTGAGLYRDVHLIAKEPVHVDVDGVRIVTRHIEADRAVIEVEAELTNLGPTTTTVDASASVTEEGIAEVAAGVAPVTLLPGASATVRHRLVIPRPALWDVDSPALYSAALQLRQDGRLLDEELVVFGIRDVQVDPELGLRLNGRPLNLRGACVHHDNGPLGAATFPAAEERRIRLLKEAGFNAIRSSHNPASSALLDACDRLGMLVVDEAFDVWTSGKSDFDYATDFPEWWKRDIEALVSKDVNHPSVIMYSIGNEIPETGTPHGGVWSRRLAEHVRSLDPTRLVTNGINGFVSSMDLVIAGMQEQQAPAPEGAGVNGMMAQIGDMMNQISASEMVSERTAESFSVLDVAGLNYGDGRYELDRALFPNRVIVGTETFPARIAHNWQLVQSESHVIGDFTWTGWDYLGEAGLGSVGFAGGGDASEVARAYPWFAAWSGDIDITGERRPISYYREIVFGLRTEPYLAVHRPQNFGRSPLPTPWSWSDSINSWSWDGWEGKPVHVEVYAAAEEVELRLNGRSLGRAIVGAEFAFRADFDIEYVFGELIAVAYVAGTETGRTSLSSAGEQLHLEAQPERAQLRCDVGDLGFIPIRLTDGHGVVRPLSDRPVTVTVSGAGVLHALGSADPATEETFVSATRTTFDGRAIAIVRPVALGDILVTIEAPGCAPLEIGLRAAAEHPVELPSLVD